jgi:predicted MPP superfamily phosphohydrolase
MLSHTPKVASGLTSNNVDIILSGHTHGGQMFPFHYFVKQANENRLAGFYNINGVNMYISRGTRYWGPPMRVLAPSEITIFNMKSK